MRVSTTRVGTALTSRLDSVSSDPIPVFPPGALDVDQGVHVLAAGIDLGRYSGIHVRRGRWRAPEMLDFPACPEMGRIDYRSKGRERGGGARPRGLRERAGPEERHAHESASATGWANLPGNSEGPFAMALSLSDTPRKSFAERLAIGTCKESFTPMRYHGAEPIAYGR